MRHAKLITCTLVMAAVMAGCSTSQRASVTATGTPTSAPVGGRIAETFNPHIDPSNFVKTIDNPYFPVRPGTTTKYAGVSDGEKTTNTITVTSVKKTIIGVETTVVRDIVYGADGKVTEDTFDWLAQDTEGNVWYFGEATKEFSGPTPDTHGSWEAGVGGAQPGIVMLASPKVGDYYREEFWKDKAQDEARIVSVTGSVDVPYGSFDHIVITENRNPLEPKLLERKYYAKGVGSVYEEMIRGGKEVTRLIDVKR